MDGYAQISSVPASLALALPGPGAGASAPDLLGLAAALAMAAVLLWGALEKARSLPAFAVAVRQLGLSARVSLPAALLLVVGEATVAIGLLYDRGSAWVQAGVAALAMLFAAAGLIALRSGESIRCSCFGVDARGELGLSQLAALPLWLAGALLLRLGSPAPSADLAAAALAILMLSFAFWRVPAVLRARGDARADRLSARETYLWLR